MAHYILHYSQGYRSLHRTYANCLVCNRYSECEISVLERGWNFFFKRLSETPEAYYFDWATCDHRVALLRKSDVDRYKEQQVLTEAFRIPRPDDMKITPVGSPIRKFTLKHYLQFAVLILLGLGLGVLLIYVMDLLGYHGPLF